MFPLQEQGTWGGKVFEAISRDATKEVQGQNEIKDYCNNSI